MPSALRQAAGDGVNISLVLHGRSLHYPVDLMGTNDEAFWRRANVVKWEACDEGKIVTRGRFQDSKIVGGDDLNGFHAVFEIVLGSLESDFVAHANIAQRTKEGIAVTCQRDITPFTRQSRSRNVTYGPPQVGKGFTLDNHGVEPQSRNLNFANHIAFDQDMRFREAARLLEPIHLQRLIGMRIRVHEGGVTQSQDADRQEKGTSATKEVRSG